MHQEKLPHPCITSYKGSLSRRRVIILFRPKQVVLTIGTFMIQRIDTLEALMQLGHIAGIAAVGIAAYRVGRRRQTTIGHHLTIFCRPVCTTLDEIEMTNRNLVEVSYITPDMRQGGFLPEQITAAWQSVFQRDGLDGERTVFVYDLLYRGIYSYKFHLVVEVTTEGRHLLMQDVTQSRRTVDGQFGCTPQEAEGAEHPHEAEAMVTMQMRDEYRTDFRKAQMGAA